MTISAPTGLRAAPASSTRNDVTWDPVPGAAGYDVERDGVVVVVGLSTTTYADQGLVPSSSHSYRVRSVGGAAVSTLPPVPWDSHVGSPTTLDEGAAFVDSLDAATDRVRVVPLGTSAQGRPIRAVVVGPPRTRDQVRAATSALIIGSHHGDEWAGREATFEHMRNHAAGLGTETIVYIPTLSPDSFILQQRNLANGSDPNRLWSQTGVDQQSSGGAYFPEQQCLRQAILLWQPKIIFDTHEYTTTSATYRFDPGTTNATGTPQPVIDADVAVLAAMRSAATAAGYTTANYGGAIPDDGATQAFKRGGIPAVFTESGQENTNGLVQRRAQQLGSMNAFQSWVRSNAATLTSVAAAATWWSGFSPTVVDA